MNSRRALLVVALVFCGLVAPPSRAVGAGGEYYRVRLALPGDGTLADAGWIERAVTELRRRWGPTVRAAVPASAARRLAARSSADPALAASVEALRRWARIGPVAPETAARLASDPGIDRIEAVAVAEVTGLVPDDPLFPNQRPALDQMGLVEAWSSAADPPDGPVLVAIVDGGTDWQHPDLLDNVARNEAEIDGDGVDQDGNGFVDDIIGWNFPADGPDPSPLPGQDFNARHGTHVAGTVGAVLGNGIGIAGSGGNPSLILVNAAHPELDGGIAYGYEGILYAVSRGAKVINCSWRTVRVISSQLYDAPYSEFEALVLAVARQSGALVVAATGNDGAVDLWTTPAGYEDAFAVAATNFTEPVPWVLSNRGPWIDAYAPGDRIMATFPRWMSSQIGPYGLLSGTSMATALASGVAAFVAGQRPQWTAEQLRTRLRWTAVEEPALEGHRMLRADRALAAVTAPDVALRLRGAADQDGDGLIEGNEILDLRFAARSTFSSQAGVRIEADTSDPWLVPLITAIGLPRIPADQDLEVQRGLRFWVHPAAPPGHVARVQLRAVSGGETGPLVSGALVLRSLSASLANDRLRVAASANGLLGEVPVVAAQHPLAPALARIGEVTGFLQRAALVLATGEDRLSHAMVPRAPGTLIRDFYALEDGLQRDAAPEGGGELVLRFSDRGVGRSLGVNVEQTVRLGDSGSSADFVIVDYEVLALDTDLDGVRWGLALDGAVPSADPLGGRSTVDEKLVVIEDGLAVAAAVDGEGTGVAGARILGGAVAIGRSGFSRWQVGEEEPGWNLPLDPAGSPSDAALWPLMLEGTGPGLDRTGDRVGLLSDAVGFLPEGGTARFAVALAIAPDLFALEEVLDRARVTWEAAAIGRTPETLTDTLVRFSHNPFRDSTEAVFSLARPGRARVEIFDLRGRRVRTLVDGFRSAGVHRAGWDGRDDDGAGVASGVYLVRLSTPGAGNTRAITRLR